MRIVLGATALVLACAACGGGTGATKTSGREPLPATDAGGDFGEIHASDLAELHGASDAGAPVAAAATPSEPPPPPDECSPVGVDFEKRARPKIKECYRDGKKKDPDLKGSIKIGLEIDYQGKTKGPKVLESTLPKAVTACMLKAVKETPLPPAEGAKCPNKTVTIPVVFPTPP